MRTLRLRTVAVVTIELTGAVIVAIDWVRTALNRNFYHVGAVQRVLGTLIHGLRGVLAACAFARGPHWAQRLVPAWFTVVLTSADLNWWLPYLTGSYPDEIGPQTFEREYPSNLSVLPRWAGHPVVPDVQHMLIHALLLRSAVLSALFMSGSLRGSSARRAGLSALRGGLRVGR